jgi:tetratricopeptide (TPR) repeat protein
MFNNYIYRYLDIYVKTKQAIMNNNLAKAAELNKLGNTYLIKNDYLWAVELFERSLALLQANHSYIKTNFYYLGTKYGALDLHYYEEYLKIQKASLFTNHSETAEVLLNLAVAYDKLGDLNMAIFNYERCLQMKCIFLPRDHPDFKFIFSILGNQYYANGDYAKSIYNFEKYLQIIQQSSPTNEVAACSYDLGVAYFSNGDFVKSIERFKMSLQLHQLTSSPNPTAIAKCLNRLGEASFGIQNYKEAI